MLTPMSSVFRLLSARLASRVSRLASRVSRPLAAVAAVLGLLSAQARYVPANFDSLEQLTGGGAQALAQGEYRVPASVTYADQLSVAENATVTLWFKNSATLTVDLSALTTGKAAVKVPSSSTLILRSADGTGALVAKGAKGVNASNGSKGDAPSFGRYGKGGAGGKGASAGGSGRQPRVSAVRSSVVQHASHFTLSRSTYR